MSSSLPGRGSTAFVKDGKAAAGNVTVLARSGIGVAVRKGAPKPDISSPEALKRTLLAAKSISYVDPASGGASGIHFAKVLDRLGIANEMKSKTVFPNPKTPAEVGVLVANGEAEIGVHVNPGIDVGRRHRYRRPAAGRSPGHHRLCGGHHGRRQGRRGIEGAGQFPAHAGGGGGDQGEGHGACHSVMVTAALNLCELVKA